MGAHSDVAGVHASTARGDCCWLVEKQFTPYMVLQPTPNSFIFLVDIEIHVLDLIKHIGTPKCQRFVL
jgi:hypothetical protein